MNPTLKSQNYPAPDTTASTSNSTKKRQRTSQANDDIVNVVTGANRPRGRSRVANKPPLSATHEIRQLRAQVAAMEDELHGLQTKWTE